jgi:hypothetical protein
LLDGLRGHGQNGFDLLPPWVGRPDHLQQRLAVAQNGDQRLVEGLGHSGGFSRRLQALRLLDLILEPDPFRDIEHDDGHCRPVAKWDGRALHLERYGSSVLSDDADHLGLRLVVRSLISAEPFRHDLPVFLSDEIQK